MKLYYHKTDGGAEYLTDKFVICPSGHKEGVFENAKYIVRIDGDIRQDAELTCNSHDDLVAALTELAEYAAQEIGLQVPDCVAGPIGKARAALKRAKGE